MLTRMRYFSLLAAVSLFILPVSAQINGVPASVTSYGFGGNISPTPGVPASVTSLGPNGFAFTPPVNGPCCFNSFFPGHQFSSLPADQIPHFNFRSLHRHNHFGPIFVPSYSSVYAYPVAVPVPYAVGDEEDEDYYAPDTTRFDRRHVRPRKEDLEEDSLAPSKPAAEPQAAEAPVTAQPSTVLIFKDGHKLDVQNYAIVGDTLFDFQDGLTHKIQLADLDLPATQKANDDRGVEFHTPANGAQ